ncbi:hypothetical protein Cgig2_028134 [Carnegiea gigantea]|uniref:Uncharacterized protein n=1 Tax=Carnegiea gigantea TaxID=171969 RepID=A0A9Q1K8C7_9CARY|nr:hypothetical protein Cgig2_028134 [Carnegiea gigantea]
MEMEIGAKRKAEEMAAPTMETVEGNNSGAGGSGSGVEAHPYAFHVSGPRNLSSPNWRDLIDSSWKDGNYKRTVMACFIQAAYLLELDRQENRSEENAPAPKWWLPSKYKLVQTLVDERDRSIFGAVLEWDRSAALADFILIRPRGGPRGHLFNPPSVSLAMSLRRIGEEAAFAWKRVRAMLPSGSEIHPGTDEQNKGSSATLKKWVPHLYVNNSDYVRCYYTDPTWNGEANSGSGSSSNENIAPSNGANVGALLFVLSKGNQKFLEAHRLEQ